METPWRFVLIPHLESAAIAAAAVAGGLLTLHVRKKPAGFIPRPVVRSQAFVTAAATAGTLSTSYFALLYTVPRLLEHHCYQLGGAFGPALATLLLA
ncbi:hypothetical protein ACIBI9_05495 [Nonomuraea sp. NPDC050451]|uniref:hypothetical protein n=1 Tax=Nonomuraea sp. NPDC050451 TaxID=3364364 RepID=UPI00379F19F0